MRLFWFILFASVTLTRAATTNYYVATDGSDSNVGSLAAPFLTLSKAQTTLRAAGPFTDGATVHVRGGNYLLSSTLALTYLDSGASAANPVVWRGYVGETAVLMGASRITNWTTYSGNIQMTDVSTQGFASANFHQLFYDGDRQRLARVPNYDANDPIYGGWLYVDHPGLGTITTNFFYTQGELDETWAYPTTGEVYIFPKYTWMNDIEKITGMFTDTNNIELATQTRYAMTTNDRYYIQGIFEELDAAGEWFLDTTNSHLYFYPPTTITEARAVYAPRVGNMLTVAAGTSNITWRNFTMQYCTNVTVGVTNSTNIIIAANIIRNSGDYENPTVWVRGGYTNGVVGNDISYVGHSGIRLGSNPSWYQTDTSWQTLSPNKHYAVNNYIHHTGEYFTEGFGIETYGVGSIVSHNVVKETPRSAIFYEGQSHLIDYNSIANVMKITDDGGAIYGYSVQMWMGLYNTTIQFNYITNSRGFGYYSSAYGTPSEASGIYVDSMQSGVNIIGNIVSDTSSAGVFLNGGSFNLVSNNIVHMCKHEVPGITMHYAPSVMQSGYLTNSTQGQLVIDNGNTNWATVTNLSAWQTSGFRGLTMPPSNYVQGICGSTTRSNTWVNNVIVFTNSTGITPYPYYWHLSNPGYHTVENNSLWRENTLPNGTYTNGCPDGGYVTWAEWLALGMDNNSSTNDVLLNTTTWQVAAESPALTLGFVNIPFSSIGAYDDNLRATWPLGDSGSGGSGSGAIGTLRATTLNVGTLTQQ